MNTRSHFRIWKYYSLPVFRQVHGLCEDEFGKARHKFDTLSNNYTFAYLAMLNSSEAARYGRSWRCSKLTGWTPFGE